MTNTPLQTEATVRVIARRAVEIYARTHHLGGDHRKTGELVIVGMGEAMTCLELIPTPFVFTEALYAAIGVNGPTPDDDTVRNAWCERIINLVAEAVAA